MAKKNLPNIPIYIGDWERDCNVLSLESEAAWMRIVFKLWTKGKQNSIKMPAKSLQNLWRCDETKMKEIINDLQFNDIADISVTEGFVEFTCRRFVKENELSKVRSNAAKQKQRVSKPDAKSGQIPDTDNESEIETKDVDKGELEKKKQQYLERRYFTNDELNRVFNLWTYACEFEVEPAKRKKFGQSALESMAMKLNCQPVDRSIEQVSQSLNGGWVNLRPLQDEGKKKDPPTISKRPKRSWD